MLTQRITTGTEIVGSMGYSGCWPLDIKRLCKKYKKIEEIEVEFNDEQIELAKKKVKN